MLSLAHLTFMNAGPLELISLARAGGFDAVGIRLIDPAPEGAFFPAVEDAQLRRKVKDELAATGIALLDVEAIWLWPQTDIPRLRAVLAAGAEMGARNVLVAGNDPDRARLTDNFGAVARMAQEYGMGVGFEFLPYTALNSLSYANEIVTEVNLPNAGMLIDILHLNRSGGSPADIAALDPARIAYGHLCDAPAQAPRIVDEIRAEARGQRLLPGDGGLPLVDFLRALPPGRPLAMEAPSSAYGTDDVARAKRAGAACRKVMAEAGIA